MVRLIILLKRKPGVTPEEFRQYYENHHVPLVMRHTGHFTQAYRRHYPSLEFARADSDRTSGDFREAALTAPTLDCITEVAFADRSAADAMFAALAEPELRQIVAEDEARFIDRASMRVFFCEDAS